MQRVQEFLFMFVKAYQLFSTWKWRVSKHENGLST